MKRTLIVAVSLLLIATLVLSASVVMADKPQKSGSGKDVIVLSNGFPSGDHETLNIHGKQAGYVCEECEPCPSTDPTCDPPIQCNVVNVPEYTTEEGVTISYVSGRKVKIGELTVFDSCAGFDPPGQEDGAEVWLPYEEQGHWVFARALGKPAKGDPNEPGYEPRRIIFQNEDGSPTAYSLFGEVTNPEQVPLMLPLGLITKSGAYKVDNTTDAGINLVRFDSEPDGKGRGKTLGKDITDMLMWSGWVFHWSLDLNGDGAVNELDVEYCCLSDYDTNGPPDGVIDPTEFQNWLDDNTEGWVFPPSLDLNGDGAVNELDVEYDCWSAYDHDGDGIIEVSDLIPAGIVDQNGDSTVNKVDLALFDPCDYDLNNDGVIDPWDDSYNEADEFENWLEDKIPGDQTESDFYVTLWEHYDTPVWVFTIADLVYSNQVVHNQGIKNLQIRFYPVATTQYTPPTPEPTPTPGP